MDIRTLLLNSYVFIWNLDSGLLWIKSWRSFLFKPLQIRYGDQSFTIFKSLATIQPSDWCKPRLIFVTEIFILSVRLFYLDKVHCIVLNKIECLSGLAITMFASVLKLKMFVHGWLMLLVVEILCTFSLVWRYYQITSSMVQP